jgi:ABC-2 type transport system ATP-binding protein
VEAGSTAIALIQDGYLLIHTTPEALLSEVEGMVWQWIVPSTELPELRQSHIVSSIVRSAKGVEVRAVAEDKPNPHARIVEPRLEDAYIYWMRDRRVL